MRSLVSSAVASLVVCAMVVALPFGCASDPPKPAADPSTTKPAKKLDCAFAKNPESCWRVFTTKVVSCLGGKASGPGKLQKDDSTLCVLPDEQAVKLATPCDPDGKCEVSELFLGKGDKKCLELHATLDKPPSESGRGAGTFELKAAHGTVHFQWDEKQKTITCPDGTQYSGTGDWKGELEDCQDEASAAGIPAYSITVSAGAVDGKKKRPGRISLEIASMDTVFECDKDDEPPPKKKK